MSKKRDIIIKLVKIENNIAKIYEKLINLDINEKSNSNEYKIAINYLNDYVALEKKYLNEIYELEYGNDGYIKDICSLVIDLEYSSGCHDIFIEENDTDSYSNIDTSDPINKENLNSIPDIYNKINELENRIKEIEKKLYNSQDNTNDINNDIDNKPDDSNNVNEYTENSDLVINDNYLMQTIAFIVREYGEECTLDQESYPLTKDSVYNSLIYTKIIHGLQMIACEKNIINIIENTLSDKIYDCYYTLLKEKAYHIYKKNYPNYEINMDNINISDNYGNIDKSVSKIKENIYRNIVSCYCNKDILYSTINELDNAIKLRMNIKIITFNLIYHKYRISYMINYKPNDYNFYTKNYLYPNYINDLAIINSEYIENIDANFGDIIEFIKNLIEEYTDEKLNLYYEKNINDAYINAIVNIIYSICILKARFNVNADENINNFYLYRINAEIFNNEKYKDTLEKSTIVKNAISDIFKEIEPQKEYKKI